MTWLFSWYWLGALAVAGPVLFHMWRRTPRGERPFSTLMFLTPSPPRITSRSRVEHWFLLFLRAASLALLALAFTRPLWRTPITDANEASGDQLLAILVDTSASMQREGIWTDLIRNVDERLAKLPPQTFVALYQFDQRFIPVVDFREMKAMEVFARRELVRARLKELKPTWNSTHLGEALVRTASALQDAQTDRAKPARQRIWLASDLQNGAEMIALQGYEWPDDLGVELLPVYPISKSNAGLQVVERNPESGDDTLRVRITNSLDSVKEQFTLRWESPDSPAVLIAVPAGQSRIVTPPKLLDGASASSLVLSGDDHDFDNRVWVAETVSEKRLVVYCGPETSSDVDGPRFFLDRVFAASNHFQVRLVEPSEANTASADAQPSLIILVQPKPEHQPMIQSHLLNGGTVLIAAPNAESLSESVKICGREGLAAKEADVSKYAMLGEVDFSHPIFSPFTESQFSDFTGIRFWKHRTISGLKALNPREAAETSNPMEHGDRVLAKFDDGDPAVVEFPIQRGRVILFTAGWHPADSQFARSSKFPMLIFRLLEYSTGSKSRSGSQPVGSPLAWPATSFVESSSTGTVVLPDGTSIASLPLDQPFQQADRPGLYTLKVPGRTEQVAVNLAAEESRTTPLTLEQLESHGLKLKSQERPNEQRRERERQRQLQLAEMEQSQKLWQWILLAVIVVLLTETLVSGWSRSSIPQEK